MLVLDKENTKTRETTILEWYEEVFPAAASYIRRKGGNLEEAKEIFQDSIVLYYEKLHSEDFEPENEHKHYLMGIVKNRWFKRLGKSSRLNSFENIDIAEESELKPVTERLINFLSRAGEKCMELLQSFYYEKLSMAQLTSRFGYSSERSATVQKYKCLEKVRDEVKQKSLSYEDFLD